MQSVVLTHNIVYLTEQITVMAILGLDPRTKLLD